MKTVSLSGIFFPAALATVAMLTGCWLLPSDESDDPGTISGVAYNEFYESYDEVDLTYDTRVILDISPPIDDQDIIVTDSNEVFSVSDVEPGSYSIKPRYSDDSYTQTFEVLGGVETELDITFPSSGGLYYYAFNTSLSAPPFDSTDVRNALAKALDRMSILSDAGVTDRDPAYNFVPNAMLDGSWGSNATEITESVSEAETLLEPETAFSFTVLYNEGGSHPAIFSEIKSQLEALDKVDSVNSNSLTWEQYVAEFNSGNFQITRVGWTLDSNNMFDYFNQLVGPGNASNYSNATLTTLLADAQSALDGGDIQLFEDKIVEINDHLVEEVPLIPIYFY